MFAPAYAPACFSEGLVNSKLALAFIEAGWDVVAVTLAADGGLSYSKDWDPTFMALQDTRREAKSAPIGRAKHIQLAYDIARTRHWIRGVHWGTTALRVALEEHRHHPFDLVISRSTSCLAHLPAMLFKKDTGVRWLANWNDPALHLFPKPYEFKTSVLERWGLERYFRNVACSADVNTFPSARLADYLRPTLDLKDNSKIAVVPHVGLSGRGRRTGRTAKDSLVFCHAGNLSSERDPLPFLKAFAQAIAQNRDIAEKVQCVILGVANHDLHGQIKAAGLEGVITFSGAQNYAKALDTIDSSDISVLIEANCSEGIFLPSKVSDYAQTGGPILSISPSNGVMKDLLADEVAGLHADAGSEQSIAIAIGRLITIWKANRLEQFNSDKLWSEVNPQAVIKHLTSL